MKHTRSQEIKHQSDSTNQQQKQACKIQALQKVFYIAEELINDDCSELQLESFYHPGKGKSALFITHSDKKLVLEVMEFAEPRRSWLINSDVCSNGKIYITTPFDTAFLALHHIRKHCLHKALSLDSIYDENNESTARMLRNFVAVENLNAFADVKTVSNADMTFFKYNDNKTLAWLSVKVRRVAASLQAAGVHCGHSALSHNYARSENIAAEETQNVDYLRMACGIVGAYIDVDLYEHLIKHFGIPSEMQIKTESATAVVKGSKRKSLQSLDSGENKKIKLQAGETAMDNLKESGLLNDSLDDERKVDEKIKPTPLRERTLTAKEKALVKSAKGTKSIASFFKK